MNIKIHRFFAIGCLWSTALSWNANAITPMTGGTPVMDLQVSKDVQALNLTQHRDAVDEINELRKQVQIQKQQLQQLGNPTQYINLLRLDQFDQAATSSNQGISAVIQSRQTASGANALAYTGQGLYADLSKARDAQGGPVITDQTSFKKFAVMQDMYEKYETELTTYDAKMQSLQEQLVAAMDNLNKAATQMETLKYQAQVNGIDALINALASKMGALGQQVIIQQMSNQNDAARLQELANQRKTKEQQASVSNFIQYLKLKTSRATSNAIN